VKVSMQVFGLVQSESASAQKIQSYLGRNSIR
jgi:hypothetical protein